jgi:hypothetical protein
MVSHSKECKVILLWWGYYRFWFLLIFCIIIIIVFYILCNQHAIFRHIKNSAQFKTIDRSYTVTDEYLVLKLFSLEFTWVDIGILHVHEIEAFMPKSPVSMFLMLRALHRMVWKNSKKNLQKRVWMYQM